MISICVFLFRARGYLLQTSIEEVELISGTVNINNKNSITVAANHRPPNRTDEAYISKIRDKITLMREKGKINPRLINPSRLRF